MPLPVKVGLGNGCIKIRCLLTVSWSADNWHKVMNTTNFSHNKLKLNLNNSITPWRITGRYFFFCHQVQVFLRDCHGRMSCTVAVAAKAGDDVVVIDYGGAIPTESSYPVTVKVFRNGAMTPGFQVISRDEGRMYIVSLSTCTWMMNGECYVQLMYLYITHYAKCTFLMNIHIQHNYKF